MAKNTIGHYNRDKQKYTRIGCAICGGVVDVVIDDMGNNFRCREESVRFVDDTLLTRVLANPRTVGRPVISKREGSKPGTKECRIGLLHACETRAPT